ncbi:MAG: substrate-binding domain-containing protein [Spirochaetia bacterium]
MLHKKDNSRNKPLIGAFINNLFNEYSVNIWKGIKTKIEEIGGNALCFVGGSLNNPYYNSKLRSTVYNLASFHPLDGIIILSSSLSTYLNSIQFRSFLESFCHLPIVNIGRSIDGFLSVKANNYDSMFELVTHCIKEHGCKKIAIIKGPANNDDAVTRFFAYKDALQKNDIPYTPDLVINGSFYSDCGRTAVMQLIDCRKADFDALLCSNDYVAHIAIEELHRRGISVPDDKIVTGFDDIYRFEFVHTPLTTVHQPCFELGNLAVENLCSILGNKAADKDIELASRFIARQSCGCGDRQIETKPAVSETDHADLHLNLLDIRLSAFKNKISRITQFHELQEIIFESFPQFLLKSCFIYMHEGDTADCTPDSTMQLMGYRNYKMIESKNGRLRLSYHEMIPLCTRDTDVRDNVYIYSMVHGETLLGSVAFIIDKKEKTRSINTQYNTGSMCELLTHELAAVLYKIKSQKTSGQAIHAALDSQENSGFNLSKTKKYYKNLIMYMETEKPYINDDLSLHGLARELRIPRNYLSYIINNNVGVTFYEFINRYRIKEAVRLLSNSKNKKLNILHVAYNSGFKAKSTFNKMFKLHTGMTPSDYRRRKSAIGAANPA